MASFYAVTQIVQLNSVGSEITLNGSGTSWSGSPFSVSGGTGSSITAQSVSSTTLATITLHAGSALGILTISDGSNTTLVFVVAANWQTVISDNFNRANTSVGGANTTTGAGNNWADSNGNIFSIVSNQLSANAQSSFNYSKSFLYRPVTENATDERIVTQFPYTGQATPDSWLAYLRQSGNGTSLTCYLADVFVASPSLLSIYSSVAGSLTQIGSSQNITMTDDHAIQTDWSVWGTGPTNYLCIVTDLTACAIMAHVSGTDTTGGLQTSGGYALGTNPPSSGSNTMNFSNAATYYNSDTGVAIAPNNTAINYNGRWRVQPTVATTINCGANLEFAFSGSTQVTLNFSTSGLTVWPTIITVIDDGAPLLTSLSATINAIQLYPETSSSAHHVQVWAAGIYEGASGSEGNVNQWNSQLCGVLFAGLNIDTGGTMLTQDVSSPTIEFLGDSITASSRLYYAGSASDQTVMDGYRSWPAQTARKLGYRPVITGFGGQGVFIGSNTSTGSGNVPLANAAFPFVYSGVSYSPAQLPSVVVVAQGMNDAGQSASQANMIAAYTTYLATIRAAYPKAQIFVVALPNLGNYGAANTFAAAIVSMVATIADSAMYALNYNTLLSAIGGADYNSQSGNIHPNLGGATKIACQLASDIQAQLASSLFTPQVASAGLTLAVQPNRRQGR